MKAYDKEFYELREQFEKDHKISISRSSLERAKKDKSVPVGTFYADGITNELFHMYMSGYTYGKCLFNLRGIND